MSVNLNSNVDDMSLEELATYIIELSTKDLIKKLSDKGVNYSKMSGSNIVYSIGKLTSKIIDDFYQIGVELDKKTIAEVSSTAINALSKAGANFSKLDGSSLVDLIKEFGSGMIKPLSEAGANFSKLKDPAVKLIVEKELFVSKDSTSDVEEKVYEYNEISSDKSLICEDKGFNYADICYKNDIENCLSCGHLGNPSEDFLII